MDVEGCDKVAVNLEFLTDDPREQELCRHYFDAFKYPPHKTLRYPLNTNQLAAKYNITIPGIADVVRGLVKASFGACGECGKPIPIKSRADLQRLYDYLYHVKGEVEKICPACCELEAQKEIEERRRVDAIGRELIRAYFPHPDEISFSDLTLRDCVYLIAAHRASDSVDSRIIAPFDDVQPKVDSNRWNLAPEPVLQEWIIEHLLERLLIRVDPESNLSAFKFRDDGLVEVVNPLACRHIIAGTDDRDMPLIEQIENVFDSGEWLEGWADEIVSLWHEVAHSETLAYLAHYLDDHRLDSAITDRAWSILDSAVWKFSVQDLYCLIWRSVRDAAVYAQRTGIKRDHARNVAIQKLDTLITAHAEKHGFADKWTRPTRLPQTAISKVFFDDVLGVGDAGFTKIPKWPLR